MAAAREPRGPPRTGDSHPSRPPLLKINLRLIDNNEPRPSRNDIFKTICADLKGFLTRLTDNYNGFTAFSDLTDTIDAITSQKGHNLLRKLNLEPVAPPEIRAKRTVFLRGLDRDIITNHSIKDICDELTARQPWLTDITAYRIKDYTHVLKLVCSDTGHANRITTDGLTAFHTRISPHNCSLEKFTPLQICFKCYQYENHTKFNCPSTSIVCSECAQTGHTHRDCTSTTKKCLNCPPPNNNHRTLAPSCPVKRTATKDKDQRLNLAKDLQTNKTYSQIVKTTIKETEPSPRPTITITDKTNFKLVALIIEAHVAAITGDRPYNDILSESLRLNYNLDAQFPDRDSQRILDMYLTNGQTNPTPTPPTQDKEELFILSYTDFNSDMEEETVVVERADQQPYPLPQRHQVGAKPKANKKRQKTTPDSPTVTKQRKRDEDQTYVPPSAVKDQYTYRIFRSDADPEPIPNTITANWFTYEVIDRKVFGLKIHVHGDIDRFKKHIRDKRLTPKLDHIRVIDDETFRLYHRIARYGGMDRPSHPIE